MKIKQYLVIQDHVSEYPEPITLSKGAQLSVGEKYQGPEAWNDWYFCNTPGQAGGWVPAQVIEFIDDSTGRARENYTARELSVKAGSLLHGLRTLNGWAWCENPSHSEFGWVPLVNLEET